MKLIFEDVIESGIDNIESKDYKITVDFGSIDIEPEERNEIRQKIHNVLREIGMEESHSICYFEDECPECNNVLIDNDCHNDKCICSKDFN
jgi:hypothetical protein